MKREVTLQTRGTSRDEFLEYFSTLGEKKEEGFFCGPNWEVSVGAQDTVTLGPMHFPRVFITFRIEENNFEEFLFTFRKAFMRAGA